MKRKIALTWFKRTWKDYVAENFFWDHKLYRIADNIKLSCVSTHTERGDDFLLEDDKVYTDLYTSWKIIANPNVLPLRFIESSSLSDIEILLKINVYKTIPELKTRSKIYEFLEVQDKKWYDFWIKETINDINALPNDKVIVTDCRMLIEAVDFLLDDFLLLSLYNSRVLDIKKNLPNWLFHSTELQLWLLWDEWIWYSLDVTSRDSDYLKSIISEIVELFYRNFNGYSQEFKEKLLEFRKELLSIITVLEKEIDLLYNEKNITDYNRKVDILKQYQNKLRKLVREEYVKHIIF